MPLDPHVVESRAALVEWRRHLHAHPEIAFHEHRTSQFVAERLRSFGIEVHEGLAGTGVVGVLPGSKGSLTDAAIGLRADMDALRVEEKTGLPYASKTAGLMHACGHDGHTTMLLGAAKSLAARPDFAGTVYFVFQPAEENEGGGRTMVEQGLFRKFPCRAVYGMHNWPGLPVGQFAVHSGPVMACFDIFEIVVQGQGTHAAMPHLGLDPIPIAAHLITALQTIVSRTTDPLDSGVVSVTQVHAGDTWNVIPDQVVLRGSARSFQPHVRDLIEARVTAISQGVARAHGAECTVRYERRCPATVNTHSEAEKAVRAAAGVVGSANVVRDPLPSMASEDFAFMLQEVPGCYIWAGNGPGDAGRRLHSPYYDFNDELLAYGASFWVSLVRTLLAA